VRMASWQPRASLSRPTPSCGDLGGSPSSAGGTLRRSQSHSTPCWRASWQRPPSTRPLLQPWDFALSARSAGPRLRARRAEIAFSTPSLPPQALSRPAPRGQHGEGTTSPPPGRAHCRWAGVGVQRREPSCLCPHGRVNHHLRSWERGSLLLSATRCPADTTRSFRRSALLPFGAGGMCPSSIQRADVKFGRRVSNIGRCSRLGK